jgi:hypothetical protein
MLTIHFFVIGIEQAKTRKNTDYNIQLSGNNFNGLEGKVLCPKYYKMTL